jgi:signal transduction histidine kinase
VDTKSEAAQSIEHARHDLDDALKRLAKLPAVDADRLTYAAHALNNYLMVVSTISHVLERSLSGSSIPNIEDRLSALNEATKLMKAAVQQLILPSAVGRPHLLFLPVNLQFVAGAACDEYEPIARTKGIRIERNITRAPVVLWTDRIAFGAVIDNLMSNAVKYSKPAGAIIVRAYRLGDEGVFAVSDSGPGIRPEEASLLFSRGGRLSAQPTGGETSTGYGLAIAKDLADELGARIWWQNDAEGASFSVGVPLYEPSVHGDVRAAD